jgi:hypothetical protein
MGDSYVQDHESRDRRRSHCYRDVHRAAGRSATSRARARRCDLHLEGSMRVKFGDSLRRAPAGSFVSYRGHAAHLAERRRGTDALLHGVKLLDLFPPCPMLTVNAVWRHDHELPPRSNASSKPQNNSRKNVTGFNRGRVRARPLVQRQAPFVGKQQLALVQSSARRLPSFLARGSSAHAARKELVMTVVSTLDVHGLTTREYRGVMDELGVEARPEPVSTFI